MNSSQPIVYLMRGLPGSGKSYRARQLAGEQGIVLETDRYFYSEVGTDPESYDFDASLLPVARSWVFEQLRTAVSALVSPIVLDRGNGLNIETREYAAFAHQHGYQVELAEPESAWWQELRVLLKYKRHVADEVFDGWAKHLSDRTQIGHRVPAAIIRRWMQQWRFDLTVAEILDYREDSSSAPSKPS